MLWQFSHSIGQTKVKSFWKIKMIAILALKIRSCDHRILTLREEEQEKYLMCRLFLHIYLPPSVMCGTKTILRGKTHIENSRWLVSHNWRLILDTLNLFNHNSMTSLQVLATRRMFLRKASGPNRRYWLQNSFNLKVWIDDWQEVLPGNPLRMDRPIIVIRIQFCCRWWSQSSMEGSFRSFRHIYSGRVFWQNEMFCILNILVSGNLIWQASVITFYIIIGQGNQPTTLFFSNWIFF